MTSSRFAAAILAGCLVSTAAMADDFNPIPNTVKYKDSGIPNAKGRSGSAEIEARALLNQNQSADIEVTAAQGVISKVQLKTSSDSDAVNFTNVAGGNFFSISNMAGLYPRQVVQLQANVRAVDGSRTDVVTVQETVKKRPDPTFVWIKSQQHGMVGAPINVTAIVAEMNGDSGARADCVLFADGAEVDRASNIWVDAGGSVTCEFSPAFQEAGKKALKVVLENVRPGDWDTTNNQVDAETWVHGLNEEFAEWRASGFEQQFDSYRTFTGPNFGEEEHNVGWLNSASLNAYQPEFLNPDTLKMSYRLASDGNVLQDMQDVTFTGWTEYDEYSCGRAFNGPTHATICTWNFPGSPFPPRTSFSINTNGGDVTYYSSFWQRWYDANGNEQYYTYNGTWQNNSGLQQRFGTSLTIDATFSDGTRSLFAHPFVPLQSYANTTSYNQCWGSYCEQYRSTRSGKFGEAYGGY